MPEFQPWPKIARLNRDIVITEKIDGTNAAIGITEDGQVYAQSRTRIITPEKDNFGFAAWVEEHKEELADTLGPGIHYGEWWGQGIQRTYGLTHRRLSLFNVKRWQGVEFPESLWQLGVVPVLYEGPFHWYEIHAALRRLRDDGSYASIGYMKPEGIVIFHTAAGIMFKVTLEGDEKPKGKEDDS